MLDDCRELSLNVKSLIKYFEQEYCRIEYRSKLKIPTTVDAAIKIAKERALAIINSRIKKPTKSPNI